ncbi:MAG: hypothetical protein ACXW1W_09345 [Methylococcaceae bacterium]
MKIKDNAWDALQFLTQELERCHQNNIDVSAMGISGVLLDIQKLAMGVLTAKDTQDFGRLSGQGILFRIKRILYELS